jgi:hypothetical protein
MCKTDCRGFKLFLFVNVVFICESNVRGEDRQQGN